MSFGFCSCFTHEYLVGDKNRKHKIQNKLTNNSEKAMATHSSTLAWKNPMDRGAWQAAVYSVAQSQTRLRDFTFTFHFSCIGEGNGNPLQCSCLENPREGGACWAAVYGVSQIQTRLKHPSSNQQFVLCSERKLLLINCNVLLRESKSQIIVLMFPKSI